MVRAKLGFNQTQCFCIAEFDSFPDRTVLIDNVRRALPKLNCHYYCEKEDFLKFFSSMAWYFFEERYDVENRYRKLWSSTWIFKYSREALNKRLQILGIRIRNLFSFPTHLQLWSSKKAEFSFPPQHPVGVEAAASQLCCPLGGRARPWCSVGSVTLCHHHHDLASLHHGPARCLEGLAVTLTWGSLG